MANGDWSKMKNVKLMVILGVSVLVFGCGRKKENPPSLETASEVIENFTLCNYRMNEKQWELSSLRAEIYQDASIAWLEKPRLVFYRQGQKDAVLFAEKGKINLTNNNLETLGKTTVDTADGQHLVTRNVILDSAGGKIFTKEYVVIKSKSHTLSGQGLETDTSLQKIVIYNEKVVSN